MQRTFGDRIWGEGFCDGNCDAAVYTDPDLWYRCDLFIVRHTGAKKWTGKQRTGRCGKICVCGRKEHGFSWQWKDKIRQPYHCRSVFGYDAVCQFAYGKRSTDHIPEKGRGGYFRKSGRWTWDKDRRYRDAAGFRHENHIRDGKRAVWKFCI